MSNWKHCLGLSLLDNHEVWCVPKFRCCINLIIRHYCRSSLLCPLLSLSSFVRKRYFPKCNDSAFEKVEVYIEICQIDLHRWVSFYFEIRCISHGTCYRWQAFLLPLQSSFYIIYISSLWGLNIIGMLWSSV